jgi:hypothetical protein
MKIKRVACVCGVALAVAIGCGGSGGGIDRSKTLGSLSAADQMTECHDLASQYPRKSISCGSAGSDTVGIDPAECSGSNFQMIPASCTVTVGQLEDCDSALYNAGSALCNGTIPSACTPLENAGSACQ